MAVTLKDKLIHCLRTINETGHYKRLEEIISLLKKPTTIIPSNDELGVLLFIFTLTCEMPELIKNSENDLLKNFCLSLNPDLLSLQQKPGINPSSRHQ